MRMAGRSCTGSSTMAARHRQAACFPRIRPCLRLHLILPMYGSSPNRPSDATWRAAAAQATSGTEIATLPRPETRSCFSTSMQPRRQTHPAADRCRMLQQLDFSAQAEFRALSIARWIGSWKHALNLDGAYLRGERFLPPSYSGNKYDPQAPRRPPIPACPTPPTTPDPAQSLPHRPDVLPLKLM